MGPVALTFLGAGGAFGTGGRLQTCMHLRGEQRDDAVSVAMGKKSRGL
jgi:hypothetical protein